MVQSSGSNSETDIVKIDWNGNVVTTPQNQTGYTYLLDDFLSPTYFLDNQNSRSAKFVSACYLNTTGTVAQIFLNADLAPFGSFTFSTYLIGTGLVTPNSATQLLIKIEY